ncbi:MAG: FHA domain-containing protein [Spirochaetota bacterium]|nr:FHA domain-containing protein [Spirochaetota bacterium]
MVSQKVQVPSDVTLEVIKGVDQGKIFSITKKTITIGREKVCDIKLLDEFMSKKHCQIVFRNGHFTAIDLGSLNKTKINNRIYVQKNLKDNDIISLGKTKLRFHWKEQDVSSVNESDDVPDLESDIKDEIIKCDD